jgi:hypothetical protein
MNLGLVHGYGDEVIRIAWHDEYFIIHLLYQLGLKPMELILFCDVVDMYLSVQMDLSLEVQVFL